MSQDQPPSPGSFEFPPVSPQVLEERYRWVQPPPIPRPAKFQHRLRLPLILFVVTLITTTLAGAGHYVDFLLMNGVPLDTLTLSWDLILKGLWYSAPILVILAAHEFGHYFACRYHDVDATLPFFIPTLPFFFLTGTFGAVIRIREAFPSKRALFDIGVAGPIAGFIALLPFLVIGTSLSTMTRVPTDGVVIFFGEPLLFKAIAALKFGVRPPGYDITLHPMGFAAWFGLLATALNLLPFGQLDGGHIAYAVFGRRAATVSTLTLGTAVALTLGSLSWLLFTLILVAMAFFLGIRHPRVPDEDTPLNRGRLWVAAFALLMFVLCFTPAPIDMLVGGS